MTRRVREERVEIPSRSVRDVTSEACGDLDAAINAIERWGVQVPADSRLREARSVLHEAASSGRFSPAQRGDDRGHRALQLTLDFADIARTLPAARVADLRKDLTAAISGQLDIEIDDNSPAQFQSQLMVRAALVKAGADPALPSWSGRDGKKKPDLLLENGASQYALEVKRPRRWKNILPRTKDAAGQIADTGLQGCIVLDVTDCLDGIQPEAWDEALMRAASEVSALIFVPGKDYQPGYQHILAELVFARPAWTAMEENGDTQVMVYNTSVSWAFGRARGTLGHRRGDWLRQQIEKGLNKLGFTGQEQ